SLPASHYPLLVIAWCSIVIHCLILGIILRFRSGVTSFRSAFFTLTLAQSVISIFLLLHTELLTRPRDFGLFQLFQPENHSILAAILLGCQTAQKSQLFLIQIPFAANRFTAFMAFASHNMTSRRLQISIIAHFPSFLPGFVAIPLNFNVSFVPQGDGVKLNAPREAIAMLSIAAQVCSWLSIVVCIPLYLAAAFRSRKMLFLHNNARYVKQERRHLVCALISFALVIVDSIRAFLLIIATVARVLDTILVPHHSRFHTTELMCCVQPWAMLACNVLIRKHL
ncbi:hypothetical protein PENTCL1PPCAC_5162, partial [Pristionchus entomophagus]